MESILAKSNERAEVIIEYVKHTGISYYETYAGTNIYL
jgi:hypothetical protein